MAYTRKVDSEKFNKTFPERLRELLDEKGVTHKELAEFITVTPQAIGSYTRGETTPKINEAKKIAEYFNVSLDYLSGISNVKCTDIDTQKINKLTGLSEEAIEHLQSNKTVIDDYEEGVPELLAEINILNYLLHDDSTLGDIVELIFKYREIKNILLKGNSQILPTEPMITVEGDLVLLPRDFDLKMLLEAQFMVLSNTIRDLIDNNSIIGGE